MPIPEPLALSDSQITAVMSLAKPLPPNERSRFLELLVAKLNGRAEIGDGQLYRLLRELQRECFTAPNFGSDNGGKWNGKAVRRPRHDDDGEDDRPLRRRDVWPSRRGTA